MRPERYRAAAALAGPALLRLRPGPQPVEHVTGSERNAVYVVCDRTGRVRYVGSTIGRPARHRIAEHLADARRVRAWHEAWVVPLRATTPQATVRAIEGRVGRFLRPADTRCLPRPMGM
jgi:hypothetical protein